MKKSVLIIGIGRLGAQLAEKMQDMGNDVMILDNNKDVINKHAAHFADARIADYTNEDVLRQIDAASFDLCFITAGENFEGSMTTTYLLKKLGAKFVASRARDDIQCELLKCAGADEVIFADGEIAENLAVRHNGNNVYDYVALGGGYALFEVPIVPSWAGKTILELDVRKKYKINIIAIKNGEALNATPMPDYCFAPDDHILVIGMSKDVFKLTTKK